MGIGSLLLQHLPATAHPDFRRLLAGATASSIALWTLLLGNAWVVYELSDSSFWVGMATFAGMFPLFLSPIGGVVADRFERRTLLSVTRVIALATAGVLLGLALLDVLTVWLVVLMAFVQGLVRAVETPAEQALIPNTVPPADIGNAMVLGTAARLGSRAVGPLLAGPFLASVGVTGAYAVALGFTLASLVLVLRVETASRGGVTDLRDVRGTVASLVDGLRYVRGHQGIFVVFLLVVAHCALTMSFDALLPAFARTNLDSPTNGLTILIVSLGAGAFVGTLGLALLGVRGRGPFFLVTALISGGAPILLAASQAMIPAAASAVLVGASQAMFMALAAVFIQEVVDDAYRGRVMSLYGMSAGGVMAFANLLLGSLTDVWGAPAMLLLPAVVFLVIVVATLFTGPHLRRIYGSGGIAVEPAAG